MEPAAEPTPHVLVRAAALPSDPDNLAAEIAINNLSVILVPTGSTTVAYRFANAAFSAVDITTIANIQRASLPLAQGALPPMDVYVLANYSVNLDAVSTVADIEALQTPQGAIYSKNGLPMFGLLQNVDLNAKTPVVVPLVRPCAKIRVNLYYPNWLWIGSNNRLTIENAAPYTCMAPGHTPSFTTWVSYPIFNFKKIDDQHYTATGFVWESKTPPRLRITTAMWGVQTDYVLDNLMPLPQRNCLYDINVEIQQSPAVRSSISVRNAY